jgi:hypothetical protein
MARTSRVACVTVERGVRLELGELSRYSEGLLLSATGNTVFHGFQIRSGAHPTSCPTDTEGFNMAGA